MNSGNNNDSSLDINYTFRGLVLRLLRRLGHLYPLPSGQQRICNSRIVYWACRGVALTGAGQRGVDYIFSDLTDSHGRSAYLFGYNDGKIRDVFLRIIRPGDTVIDIGANYGAFSLLAARIVGPRGCVHAFEPQIQHATLLGRSASTNGFSHLMVHPVALSDRDGTAPIYCFGPDSGFASLSPPDPGHLRTLSNVRIARGDTFFRGLGLTSIRLVKIDTEKHEELVIKGAESFLKECPPDYILFEYYNPSVPFWGSSLILRLRAMDYNRFYEIPRSFLRTRIHLLDPATEPGKFSVNFLARYDHAEEPVVTHS